MTVLLRIAERVINRPLLIHPDKLPLIVGVLEGRIPVAGGLVQWQDEAESRIDRMPADAQRAMRGPEASRFVGSAIDEDPATGRKSMLPYRRTREGVAIITVTGSLVNRGAWLGSYSGTTSYEGIKYQIGSAAADPRSRSILLDIESPGGEAVGAFEVAAAVRAANKIKPVVAVVNGMAASAAYALASGAEQIVVTPTGLAGSIGVVLMHADWSAFLEKKGVKPTLIFAGAHKVDGNPFGPLPEEVRDDLQREVDGYYQQFVKTVAAGRAGMNPAAIRNTEARTFVGDEAVSVGLADVVGTFEETLVNLSRGTGRSTGSSRMERSESVAGALSGQEQHEQPQHSIRIGISREELEMAVSDAKKEARAEGVAAGAKSERERLAAILASDKVIGREATALRLAVEAPDMSAEKILAFVETLPAAQAPASIRDRNADLASIGNGPVQQGGDDLWSGEIAKVNKEFGVQ